MYPSLSAISAQPAVLRSVQPTASKPIAHRPIQFGKAEQSEPTQESSAVQKNSFFTELKGRCWNVARELKDYFTPGPNSMGLVFDVVAGSVVGLIVGAFSPFAIPPSIGIMMGISLTFRVLRGLFTPAPPPVSEKEESIELRGFKKRFEHLKKQTEIVTQGEEGTFDPETARKMLEFLKDICHAKEQDVMDWLDNDPDLKAFVGGGKKDDQPPASAPPQA